MATSDGAADAVAVGLTVATAVWVGVGEAEADADCETDEAAESCAEGLGSADAVVQATSPSAAARMPARALVRVIAEV